MKKNPSFILRNIYGKYILMPICANHVGNNPILLNEIAAEIWEEVGRQPDEEAIIKKISDEYQLSNDSPEQLAVRKFLVQMRRMGLLTDEIGEK